MALLATQRPGLTAAATVYNAAAGGGDTFANDGRTLLLIKNASGGSITATADDPTSLLPGAVAFNPDVACVVPAGAERVFGPFPPGRFGDVVSLAYTGVTSLTVAVLGV